MTSDPQRIILLFLMALGMAVMPSPALSSDVIKSHKPTLVSLDYCADQYVLALADRDQILALSWEADQKHSFYQARAAGLPKFHGSMAEIINIQPDIAIQSFNVPGRNDALMGRVGTALYTLTHGSDPEIVMDNLLQAGQKLSQASRAADLMEDYRARLDQMRVLPKSKLRAAYVTPSGFTAGRGTFVDEIIQLAGFSSYAAARNLTGWQSLPLEDIILDPPDIFIASFFDSNLERQSGWSMARHKRLEKILADIPTIFLPGRLLSCNGLFLVDAAEYIQEHIQEYMRAKAKKNE